MAEETEQSIIQEPGGTTDLMGGSSGTNWAIIAPIIIIVIAAQSVGAYYTMKKLFFSYTDKEIIEVASTVSWTPPETTVADTVQTVKEELPIPEYEPTGLIQQFEDVIINPAGTEGRRYFVLTMSFEVSKKKVLEELILKTPIIRDALITLLATKTLDYLSDVNNMESLRTEIMQTVNLYLEKGHLVRVYFTGYILQ